MDTSSDCQIILKKVYGFYRLTISDSDDKIKSSIKELLNLWPDVVAAGDKATDDELFTLNVSRAVLHQVFTIVLSKEFLNKDYSLIRDIFFSCFNILVNYSYIFQNNNSIFINSNVRLLMKMASCVTSSTQFRIDDLSKPADLQLLIAMREYIDQDFKNDNLTDGIISLVWNLSDTTLFVPILLKAGYAKSVVQWIENRQVKFRDDKLNAPIHILHNLSRHDDGIDQLNTYHALEVIENIEFLTDTSNDIVDMAIHTTMIRALLTDINQIKYDSKNYSNEVINMLVTLSINAAKNEKYRYDGSHVSEPLTVLVKLFYNDEILDNILSNIETKLSVSVQSLIELFILLLNKLYAKINFNNFLLENYTCVVILNLFSIISNHKKYYRIICDHEQLRYILENIIIHEQIYIDTFMPRTMKSIQQAAKDILKNFGSKK